MNQRKRQVLDSALQLFIEKGFHETSIQDILDKALISKGTFYNYFSSKVECFKSIMEQTRYEASLLRHEMLLNQDITDENLLLEQILVLMQINKKQNLVSLFENIFQSNDKEPRHLLERYRLLEIEWVSNRFTDIFGEEVRPYSLELAILYFAMVHHLTYSHRLFYSEMIDQKKILRIALRNVKAIYPIHMNPAVRQAAQEELGDCDRIHIIEPLDVLDFHNFLARCYMILTDSGGVQEEAPSLGKPVLVMRDTTERPEGVEAGTLRLVGTDEETIYQNFKELLLNKETYDKMSKASNPYGDGFASKRIADILEKNS